MKNKNSLLSLSAVICAVALVVMVIALTTRGSAKQQQFTPPPFDASAETGTPEVPEELGWGELDAQAFKASVCGVVVLDGDSADLWLTNPESNTVWLKLRALDEQGNILGETGLIKPGEYVQSVTFSTLPEDGETVLLKLMAYEPETYYSAGSATLSTTINEGGS